MWGKHKKYYFSGLHNIKGQCILKHDAAGLETYILCLKGHDSVKLRTLNSGKVRAHARTEMWTLLNKFNIVKLS